MTMAAATTWVSMSVHLVAAWAMPATAQVAAAAATPAPRPVRHSERVLVLREAEVVDSTAGVMVAVMAGSFGARGRLVSASHPLYERPSAESTRREKFREK